MMSENCNVRRWIRLAALAAALAAILFVATGASIWHVDAADAAATCPVCHIAHLSPVKGAPAATVSAPVVVAWAVPSRIRISHAPPSSLDSPPRAPPA